MENFNIGQNENIDILIDRKLSHRDVKEEQINLFGKKCPTSSKVILGVSEKITYPLIQYGICHNKWLCIINSRRITYDHFNT